MYKDVAHMDLLVSIIKCHACPPFSGRNYLYVPTTLFTWYPVVAMAIV